MDESDLVMPVGKEYAVRFATLALFICTLLIHTGEVIVSAQSNMDATESRNKELVEAGFKAWSAGTGSPYDLLADDATWTIVGRSAASKTYKGREAFMRDVIRPFNARMRDPLKPSIRRIYADGDTVIVFFDARGTARDGKPYVNTYAWFLELRDGKVIGASAFFDSLEFNELWARVAPVAVK
jgi:ketosteroid isomerase-like protein